MFSYQLQQRHFKVKPGTKLIFPNDVELMVKLEPRPPFGGVKGESRMLARAQATDLYINANNGATYGVIEIDAVNVTTETEHVVYSFASNVLHIKTHCATSEQLAQFLYSVQLALPAVLAIEFPDAPIISSIVGTVANAAFSWEILDIRGPFETTTTSRQEAKLDQTIKDLTLMATSQNRRLLAAVYYFSVARRLTLSGNGPWEFMAETVLNWSKSLEALCAANTDKHDRIRTALARLGVPHDKIERYFIPVVILRNNFDVGHISLSMHAQEDLQMIYRFLMECDSEFSQLFKSVFEKLRAGTLAMPAYDTDAASYSSSFTGFLKRLRALNSR